MTDTDTTIITTASTVTVTTKANGHGIKACRSDHAGEADQRPVRTRWNPALSAGDNHAAAIAAYLATVPWGDGEWVMAWTGPRSYVAVRIP